MLRTSELTDRITELVEKTKITDSELEEIAKYESDERITPLDNLNIGLVFHGLERYNDSVRCFGDALKSYETPEEKTLVTPTYIYFGEAIVQIANKLCRKGNEDGAQKLFVQATNVYVHVLQDLHNVRLEYLPFVLASSATVFYNVEDYKQTLQICSTYVAMPEKLREHFTPQTDAAIDRVFTLAIEKITPTGKS